MVKYSNRLIKMLFIIFFFVFSIFVLISKFSINNNKIILYKSIYNITNNCDWQNISFNFSDYKPNSIVLISELLEKIYDKYKIKFILRDGSFLHTFRRKKADMDMDIYMIIPKNMNFKTSYNLIKNFINLNKKYSELKFEYQNILLTNIFWEKSDSVRISYQGKKICDISVLTEEFLNDKKLKNPCFARMNCNKPKEKYLIDNLKYIKTKNLFTNLCKCKYMDSELFCFNKNGKKYLEIKYGKDFLIPQDKGNNYSFHYERPKKIFMLILNKFPKLLNIKRIFAGHQNEEENHFNH